MILGYIITPKIQAQIDAFNATQTDARAMVEGEPLFLRYNDFSEFKPLFDLLGEPIELNLPKENDY